MAFDRGLLLYFMRRAAGSRRAARWVTELGGGPVLLPATAVGLGLLLVRRTGGAPIQLAGITLDRPTAGRAAEGLDGALYVRTRSGTSCRSISLAFPSGHAANATMSGLCLALLLPRGGRGQPFAVWAAVWLVLAVGLSRVMLGVHWPSDVIGGWAFGLFWSLLLLRLSGHDLGERSRL
jgi:undecaprenyl-diphosphatase